MRRAALVVLALATAGCGGGSVDSYAGMTRTGALEEALNTIASTTSDPSSDLYHHRLRLLDLKRGHQPHGEKAWVATFRDEANGHHECVWMSSQIMAGDTFSAECDRVPNPNR